MSIKIGNTITSANNLTTKERISLSSVTESNLILMRSSYSDVNISLYSQNDNNNFTLGKSGNTFKVSENNSLLTSFSLASNIFYSPTYLNNSVFIGQSLNIANTLQANGVDTTTIKITPPVSALVSPNPYLLASNAKGTLLSASTNGFVNIIGNVNIGNISSNPQYSLMVDNNVSIGNSLTVPTVNTVNIVNRRITSANTTSYIDFGVNNVNTQSLIFNQLTPSWAGSVLTSALLNGNLTITGNIYANQIQTQVSSIIYNTLNITSNITTASLSMTNTPLITNSTLLINHTNYSNINVVNINVTTSGSNYSTGCNITNRFDAFTIDRIGCVQIGALVDTNSLLSVQTTSNHTTSNLFTLLGNNTTSNNILYINNNADVGIGTTSPVNRLHIAQRIDNTYSNIPLIGLYSQIINTSNYETGCNIAFISDLLAGYSNNINVISIDSRGNLSANTVTTSNNVTCGSLITNNINAYSANNINYNNSSISNINNLNTSYIYSTNIVNSNLIYTSNLNARSINTVNFFIPNLSIFNDQGYYGVFTQQLWFTGSNIVMSSLNSDRIANASFGKLIVRTDDQLIVSGNAIGLHTIGTQASSIRVTSAAQPNYELYGPSTSTYIGATGSTSGYGTNMFYITHFRNLLDGTNVNDNPSYARLKIFASDQNNNSLGMVLEDQVSININNNRNVGIGITSGSVFYPVTNTLQVQGTFLLHSPTYLGNPTPNIINPILYGRLNTAYNTFNNATSIQVGVGTTLPLCQLDVIGSIWARTSPTNIPGNIYTDGVIGIGTTTPTANLHVNGTSYFSSNVVIGIGSTINNIVTINGNTNILKSLYASNIGIGTTNPQYLLHVNGDANFESNVTIRSLKCTNTIDGNISGSASVVTNGNQPYIQSLTNSGLTATYLTVTNTIIGNINGSAYNVTFPTQENITILPNVTNIATSTNNTLLIGNTSTASVAPGSVTIGQNSKNTSNALLYVNGIGIFTSNVNVQGRLTTFGNIGSISDKTIKTDLEKIQTPLDKIIQLTGYTYKRIDSPATRECGLIAQDVLKVLPEVVNKNSDYNDLLTISYGNMAGLWVEAFKELRAEIVSLKERIKVLESNNA